MNAFWITFSASIIVLISIASLPLLNNNNNNYLTNLLNWRSSSSCLSEEVADLLVTNGTIYTSDEALPFADSMAIRNGRILRVGNYSSIKKLERTWTQELNLDGKIVVPGFVDSHVHFIPGGLQMARVSLRGVNTKDLFVDKIRKAVANVKQGSWLLGGSWNNDIWGGDLPMASWIDSITPHNPVWLSRMDGHMGLANTVALTLAGISRNNENPNDGAIVRNNEGEPTGLLIDSAMKLVLSHIPEASVDERREALLRASNHALKRGVTTVVDFGRYFPGSSPEYPWEDFSDVYKWADLSGNMMTRVCLFFPMETWSRLVDLMSKSGRVLSQWIYLGGVKAFADGSLGSNSALFREPYVDDPNNYGLQVVDLDDLYNMTLSSDKYGLQVSIHAIGDRANGLILDMYTSLASEKQIRDRRFRIEHAQHLAPGTVARFGEQSVIASVQPDHLLDDADSATKKLGSERAERGSYLFKSLLTNNAQLAFGSDWPVCDFWISSVCVSVSTQFLVKFCYAMWFVAVLFQVADINPLKSIRTSMKRIPPGWEKAWIPSECLCLKDALKAYTISAAHACFLDKYVGSLSPGKYADFVVLSTNSWEDFATEVSTDVEATYIGGSKAYSIRSEDKK
ncbi:protein LONG AFTER FAR-RED 3 isoform X2 [Lycium ferocissimum]|uniref:protein LONG AFTER FAR-RED 3 isoform X2 n=1 Tax=Lycium ferocissimum TaxID=112874 RepID=UPI0028160E74|nr:protein LONG AFTER FAR-RED 3 isoform X2 [Lycium ferocissimum]